MTLPPLLGSDVDLDMKDLTVTLPLGKRSTTHKHKAVVGKNVAIIGKVPKVSWRAVGANFTCLVALNSADKSAKLDILDMHDG